MEKQVYATSFTKGALLVRESCLIAEVYEQTKDWNATRDHVLGDNLLQARTESTGKKIWSEIATRLKVLSEEQISLLASGVDVDQRLLLWLAVCKRYKFIGDFALEVLVEKYRSFAEKLSLDDFDVFFQSKAEWHPELDKLSDSTSKKVRQVVFKMMTEANLLGAKKVIQPVVLSQLVASVLADEDKTYFPISGA
jgi:hypothetical protein